MKSGHTTNGPVNILRNRLLMKLLIVMVWDLVLSNAGYFISGIFNCLTYLLLVNLLRYSENSSLVLVRRYNILNTEGLF